MKVISSAFESIYCSFKHPAEFKSQLCVQPVLWFLSFSKGFDERKAKTKISHTAVTSYVKEKLNVCFPRLHCHTFNIRFVLRTATTWAILSHPSKLTGLGPFPCSTARLHPHHETLIFQVNIQAATGEGCGSGLTPHLRWELLPRTPVALHRRLAGPLQWFDYTGEVKYGERQYRHGFRVCLQGRGWNQTVLKVPSIPNQSVILCILRIQPYQLLGKSSNILFFFPS